jgi:hypothetical protein
MEKNALGPQEANDRDRTGTDQTAEDGDLQSGSRSVGSIERKVL